MREPADDEYVVGLEARIAELEAALSEAQARILDLEAIVRGLGGHIPDQ